MKIIASSVVPKRSPFIHLGYVAAHGRFLTVSLFATVIGVALLVSGVTNFFIKRANKLYGALFSLLAIIAFLVAIACLTLGAEPDRRQVVTSELPSNGSALP